MTGHFLYERSYFKNFFDGYVTEYVEGEKKYNTRGVPMIINIGMP